MENCDTLTAHSNRITRPIFTLVLPLCSFTISVFLHHVSPAHPLTPPLLLLPHPPLL